MKLTLIQFIAFGFMIGYVGCDAFGMSRSDCVTVGAITAFIAAYLNDAHGIFWKKLKYAFHTLKKVR